MRSATDFLPSRMIEFMNLEITKSLNFGSGLTSRLSALCRRDIRFLPQSLNFASLCGPHRSSLAVAGVARCKKAHLFGPLCSILGAPLLAVGDALRVEHAPDDVIAHARQVFDAATADHHHGMLLQVVAFARDVADHFKPV